jgi:hypothetical protein
MATQLFSGHGSVPIGAARIATSRSHIIIEWPVSLTTPRRPLVGKPLNKGWLCFVLGEFAKLSFHSTWSTLPPTINSLRTTWSSQDFPHLSSTRSTNRVTLWFAFRKVRQPQICNNGSKSRQDKARQGKTRQGKARQGKARQGKARVLRTVALTASNDDSPMPNIKKRNP